MLLLHEQLKLIFRSTKEIVFASNIKLSQRLGTLILNMYKNRQKKFYFLLSDGHCYSKSSAHTHISYLN